jgi:molybdate/tungstate transport system permease protein
MGLGMLLFLLIPILVSLTRSVEGIPQAITDIRTLEAILTSFKAATLSTLLILLFGVPLAYILEQYDFTGQQLIDPLIDLPILLPHNAAGISLLVILSPGAPLGEFLQRFGLGFMDSLMGITAAMAFVSAPFMIRSVQDSFSAINPELVKVARSLGANRYQVFTNILLPLSLRGIVTGCLLTWTRSISEFGAVIILAYYPKTAPVHLYDVFISEGLGKALPINGLLVLLAIIILIGFRAVTQQERR